MAAKAYCHGCGCVQAVDANWRALWIRSDGDLITTWPEHACDIDFERPGTAFACGQGAALRIVERYLHSGSFAPAAAPAPITPFESGEDRWIAHLT
jgi:hypothetical protein